VTPLEASIRRRIAQAGPMPVAEYMALCLGHPEHGYYRTRDPLGRGGDFVTAPEVSQMFGELIGLWLAETWRGMGAPSPVVMAELGPGRGTLMADALRATARTGLHEAARPWLIETSPVLRAEQARRLPGATSAERVQDLPDGPLLLVANEFFDALPVRQAVMKGGRWRERVVGIEAGRLTFGLAGAAPGPPAPEGAVREWSPASEAVAAWIGSRLAEAGGAALIVDYGAEAPAAGGGDTLQALRGGAFDDPLAAPGEADLTAHVDFGALARAAVRAGARSWPLTTQGAFLERLGIVERARALARAAAARSGPAPSRTARPPSPARDGAGPELDPVEAVVAAHRRLTHPEAMGTLFKVLALTAPDAPRPPGV